MGKFAVEMNRTASATLSIGSVVADATRPRRGLLYFLSFGSEATPGDGVFSLQVGRITAAGTSTPVTPAMINPADAATEADAGESHTVEATYTAGQTLLSIPCNQRTTVMWTARPGSELVYPATASNGLGIRTPTAGALVYVTATAHVEEQ